MAVPVILPIWALQRWNAIMSNRTLVELKALMIDGLLLSGAASPTRADVERGCRAEPDGAAEYREGSRVRVRLRVRASDRLLEANIDGALYDVDRDGGRPGAVAAVAAMFRA
jgi:hypothetical protein